MSKKKKIFDKYFLIGAVFFAACLIYVFKLVDLQITGVDRYNSQASERTWEHRETIQAVRGEIYDRNGNLLVKNIYSDSLVFDYESLYAASAGINKTICNTVDILWQNGFKLETEAPFKGTYPHVEYDPEKLEISRISSRLKRFCKKQLLDEDIPAVELYEHLLVYYKLLDEDGNYKIDPRFIDDVVMIRYDMETGNFSADSPYIISENAELELVTAMMEHNCEGVRTKRNYDREYCYPGVASHILGRIGKIPAEQIEEYTSQGYAMDAKVGVEGAEEAFEQLLRGIDGTRVIVTDDSGNVIDSYIEKEPIPGKNVYLTIDIELQKVAEKALEENIQWVVKKGQASGKENQGEKADSGAVTVMKTGTSEVLAMASYPTYDLNLFQENYATLSTDEKKPLFNRALFGNYAPGSTFKVATAAAALTNNVISSNTVVNCKGRYYFYDDYQPRCWYHSGHGNVNPVSALGVSCNCFFFDAGRLLGIDTLNDYCTKLGLGQSTGIELQESTGVLASPAYKEERGELWMPGDTLQAAIGQSVNAVTPLQLTSYISTVLNKGTKYKCTLLYKTEDYSGENEQINTPTVVSQAEISEYTLGLLKKGMQSSKENTSTARKYKFPFGCKTGTAQITNSNANALFTAFAPYNDPEITVSCVIEEGFSGVNAVPAVLDIFSYYFDLNEDGSAKTESND